MVRVCFLVCCSFCSLAKWIDSKGAFFDQPIDLDGRVVEGLNLGGSYLWRLRTIREDEICLYNGILFRQIGESTDRQRCRDMTSLKSATFTIL